MASVASDLDLAMSDSMRVQKRRRDWSWPERRKVLILALRRLLRHISSTPNLDFILPVMRYARYPLLSMQHRYTGVEVQIVANDVRDQLWVFHFRDQYPAFRAIYHVVKATLESHGLADVSRGGMGSYSILGMVAASFRFHPNVSKDDAAGHLIALLKFYSEFDTVKYGIDLTTPQIFEKTEPFTELSRDEPPKDLDVVSTTNWKEVQNAIDEQDTVELGNLAADGDTTIDTSSVEDSITSESKNTIRQNAELFPGKEEVFAGRETIARTNPQRPYLLCLQDPAAPTNDLGRKAIAIKQILAIFQHLHHALQSAIDSDQSSSPHKANSDVDSIVSQFASSNNSFLLPWVGTSFSGLIDRRRRLLVTWYNERLAKRAEPSRIRKIFHP